MKKIAFKSHSTKLCLVGTLLLMAPLFASCDLNDKEEPILIIEPPMGGFIIDEDGIPRRDDGTTQLSEEEKQLITKSTSMGHWFIKITTRRTLQQDAAISISPQQTR